MRDPLCRAKAARTPACTPVPAPAPASRRTARTEGTCLLRLCPVGPLSGHERSEPAWSRHQRPGEAHTAPRHSHPTLRCDNSEGPVVPSERGDHTRPQQFGAAPSTGLHTAGSPVDGTAPSGGRVRSSRPSCVARRPGRRPSVRADRPHPDQPSLDRPWHAPRCRQSVHGPRRHADPHRDAPNRLR